MGAYEGVSDRREWWSATPLSEFRGAPFRIGKWMSSKRFDAISTALKLTNLPPPTFFNNHYAKNYSPSWISCLDKSMNSWMDKFCPGFMCVPRKPHPFGNEYHSIADGDQGRAIMWRVELVEGKDWPKLSNVAWASPCEYEVMGESKTATLML